MRRYARLWRGFWSVVTVAAVGLSVLEWSVWGVLFTLALLYAVGWLLASLLPDRVLAVLPRPLTVASVSLAVWALSLVSFALGVLVVMTAAVTHPAVLGRALRSSRRTTASRAEPTPPAALPAPESDSDDLLTVTEVLGPLKGLDDRQLCRVWRESFWALRTPTSSPATKLCLVALREACLDELERRHSHAVHAWLDHGARASSGPEKYLEER